MPDEQITNLAQSVNLMFNAEMLGNPAALLTYLQAFAKAGRDIKGSWAGADRAAAAALRIIEQTGMAGGIGKNPIISNMIGQQAGAYANLFGTTRGKPAQRAQLLGAFGQRTTEMWNMPPQRLYGEELRRLGGQRPQLYGVHPDALTREGVTGFTQGVPFQSFGAYGEGWRVGPRTNSIQIRSGKRWISPQFMEQREINGGSYSIWGVGKNQFALRAGDSMRSGDPYSDLGTALSRKGAFVSSYQALESTLVSSISEGRKFSASLGRATKAIDRVAAVHEQRATAERAATGPSAAQRANWRAGADRFKTWRTWRDWRAEDATRSAQVEDSLTRRRERSGISARRAETRAAIAEQNLMESAAYGQGWTQTPRGYVHAGTGRAISVAEQEFVRGLALQDSRMPPGARAGLFNQTQIWNQLSSHNMPFNRMRDIINRGVGQQYADILQRTGQTNAFGRTAVAMSVLYGMQSGATQTVGIARNIELAQARIAAISGQTFPGQGGYFGQYGMRRAGMRIGARTGVGVTGAMGALESVLQASEVPTREAERVATLISKLSKVSGEKPDDVTNIMMAAINAFGLRGGQVDTLAASLFEARTRGVIKFGELGTGAGKVYQAGKLAGFSGVQGVQQLNAMMAAITRQGGTPAQTTTALARFIEDISTPKTMKKLEGLGITSADPMERIRQLVLAEQQARETGAPSVIQASGIFSRQLGKRGASILTDQWKNVEDWAKTGGDVEEFGRSVDRVMSTTTEKWNRFNAVMENTKALVGTDMINSLNLFVQPLEAMATAMGKAGEAVPELRAATGILRNMGELAGGLGMVGLASRVGMTLMGGAEVPNLMRGSKAMSFLAPAQLGMNMQYLWAQMSGNQNASAYLGGQIGDYNTGRLNARGRLMSPGQAMPGATFLGSAMWGVGLMALADAGREQFLGIRDERAATSQAESEVQLDRFRRLTGITGNIRGAYTAGRAGTIGKTEAMSEIAKSVRELQSDFPELANKYRLYADDSRDVISVNGKVAQSFDQIGASLLKVTGGLVEGSYGATLEAAAKAAQDKAAAAEARMTTPNFLGSALGVASGLWSGLFTAAAGEGFGSGYNRAVEAGSGGAQGMQQALEANDEYNKLQAEINKIKREELKAQRQRQEEEESAEAKAEDARYQKVQDDMLDKRKDIVKSLRDELQTLDERVQLEGQMQGLSQEEINAKKGTAERQLRVQAMMELIATNTGETADLSSFWRDYASDLPPAMLQAAQQTALLASNTAASAHAMQALGDAITAAQQQLDIKWDNFNSLQKFAQDKQGRALSTGSAIANMANMFWSPEVQPIASTLMEGKLLEQQLRMNFQQAGGAIKGANAFKATQDSRRSMLSKAYAERKHQMGLAGDYLATGQLNPLAISQLEGIEGTPFGAVDLSTMGAGDLARQVQLDEQNYQLELQKLDQASKDYNRGTFYPAVTPVANTILDMMAIPGKFRSFFSGFKKGEGFSPEVVGEIKTLLASNLTKSEFAKSPQQFAQFLQGQQGYQDLLGADPEGFGMLMQTLTQLVPQAGFKDWGDVIGVNPTNTEQFGKVQTFWDSLFGMISKYSSDTQGLGLEDAIKKITGTFQDLDATVVADVAAGFKDVDAALDELAGIIKQAAAAIDGAVPKAMEDWANSRTGSAGAVPGMSVAPPETAAQMQEALGGEYRMVPRVPSAEEKQLARQRALIEGRTRGGGWAFNPIGNYPRKIVDNGNEINAPELATGTPFSLTDSTGNTKTFTSREEFGAWASGMSASDLSTWKYNGYSLDQLDPKRGWEYGNTAVLDKIQLNAQIIGSRREASLAAKYQLDQTALQYVGLPAEEPKWFANGATTPSDAPLTYDEWLARKNAASLNPNAVEHTRQTILGLGAFDSSTGCVIKTREGVRIFTKDSPEYADIMRMFESTASVGDLAPQLEKNALTSPTKDPQIGDFLILERAGDKAGHAGFYMGKDANGKIIISGNGAGSTFSTEYTDISGGSYAGRQQAGLWAYTNPASPVRGNAVIQADNVVVTPTSDGALSIPGQGAIPSATPGGFVEGLNLPVAGGVPNEAPAIQPIPQPSGAAAWAAAGAAASAAPAQVSQLGNSSQTSAGQVAALGAAAGGAAGALGNIDSRIAAALNSAAAAVRAAQGGAPIAPSGAGLAAGTVAAIQGAAGLVNPTLPTATPAIPASSAVTESDGVAIGTVQTMPTDWSAPGWEKIRCNGDGTCDFEKMRSTGGNVDADANDFNNYLPGGNIPVGAAKDTGNPGTTPASKGSPIAQMGDALIGATISGVQAFFQALQNGGTVKEAIDAAFAALGQSIAQAVSGMIQLAIPGPMGGLLGAIGGGLVGLLISKIRGKSRKPDKTPIPVEVVNLPELWKPWTLPSSHYWSPTGLNNRGNMMQTNNNTLNITAGPKVASVVQRALNERQFQRQLARGLT